MRGQYLTRCGLRPRPGTDAPEGADATPARFFLCARCRAQVLICSCCDRGQIYCAGGCAGLARREGQRAAGRRYQTSHRGRVAHALRARSYRARQKNVTHQGSPPQPPDDLVSPGSAVTASLHLPLTQGDGHGTATGADAAARSLFVMGSCAAAGFLETSSVTELESLAAPTAGELRIGTTPVMASGLVCTIVDRLSRQYPRLAFRATIGDLPDLQDRELRQHDIDLMIGRSSTLTGMDPPVLTFSDPPSAQTGVTAQVEPRSARGARVSRSDRHKSRAAMRA